MMLCVLAGLGTLWKTVLEGPWDSGVRLLEGVCFCLCSSFLRSWTILQTKFKHPGARKAEVFQATKFFLIFCKRYFHGYLISSSTMKPYHNLHGTWINIKFAPVRSLHIYIPISGEILQTHGWSWLVGGFANNYCLSYTMKNTLSKYWRPETAVLQLKIFKLFFIV